jgi:hypothetical protein
MADAGVEQHAMNELRALVDIKQILVADLESSRPERYFEFFCPGRAVISGLGPGRRLLRGGGQMIENSN